VKPLLRREAINEMQILKQKVKLVWADNGGTASNDKLCLDDICLIISLCLIPIFSSLLSIFPNLSGTIPEGLLGGATVTLIVFILTRKIKAFSGYAFLVLLSLALAFALSRLSVNNAEYIDAMFTNRAYITNYLFWAVFATVKQPKRILKAVEIAAYIIVIANIISLLNGGYGVGVNTSNMSFGQETVLYWAIILQSSFLKKKRLSIIVSVICGIFLFGYGNRGIVLTIFAILLIYILIYLDIKRKMLILTILGLACLFIFPFFYDILQSISNVMSTTGVYSRSLDHFILNNFLDDNGRFQIWKTNLALIVEHPLVGSGIGADRAAFGSSSYYAHNLFIELMVNYGIVLGGILSIAVVSVGLSILSKRVDAEWKYLFVPFFCVGFFVLMTSLSVYFMRELGIAIMIYCSYKTYNKKRMRSFKDKLR